MDGKGISVFGFGVDHFHGVSNFLSLEAIADLTRSKGFLGMFSLLEEMPEMKKYQEATEYVFRCMPEDVSIVSSSILSAIAGYYGDHHTTSRTRGSQLWINTLMAAYWCFNLEPVADWILYYIWRR